MRIGLVIVGILLQRLNVLEVTPVVFNTVKFTMTKSLIITLFGCDMDKCGSLPFYLPITSFLPATSL